ncbi:hypothetical protein BV582_04970 [Bacillus paralicheniformis]|uniref:hypothetical protein n=1 Tax=Bacillus paralicheniformis TaxID=1648923 RepID=UPI000C782789|nr:hypothetical protein [Bacillus paralicheniformis]PLC16907.1 hypothetical protein BV582_04970 [Bacillus paralicheniformis]
MRFLNETQIHEFAIAVVNSTPVEGDSPASIEQKKLELYAEATRRSTAFKVQDDEAHKNELKQHFES